MTWIQTRSGTALNLIDPQPNQVVVDDIAHSLSQLCRFNGHTKRHYSVAEHCVLIAWHLREKGRSPVIQLDGLLHDAREAYIGDITWPMQQALGMSFRARYKEISNKIHEAILSKLGLSDIIALRTESHIVKMADLGILIDERDELLGPPPRAWECEDLGPIGAKPVGWDPDTAKTMWLIALDELLKEVRA
jgi:hypothetical protein